MRQGKREILETVCNQDWPSTREVGDLTRFSHRVVLVKLRELINEGYVKRRKHTGRHGANEYQITIDAVPIVLPEDNL